MRLIVSLILFIASAILPPVAQSQEEKTLTEQQVSEMIAEGLYRAAQRKFEAGEYEDAGGAFGIAAIAMDSPVDRAMSYLWAGYSFYKAEMWEASLDPLNQSIEFLQTTDDLKDRLAEALGFKKQALARLKRWREMAETLDRITASNNPNDPFYWRMNPDNGELFHGVTETRFPSEFGPFTRTKKTDYNPESTDISVGYAASSPEGTAAITIYLSRYPGVTTHSYFETSLKSIVDISKKFEILYEGAFEVAGAEIIYEGRRGHFRVEEYMETQGPLLTELWIVGFGDWLMKIRFTYPPAFEHPEKNLKALIDKVGWPTHLANE